MTIKKFVLPAIAAAITLNSNATIVINLQGDLLKDHLGTPTPNNSLVLLLASVSDASFATIIEGNFSIGSALGSSDDYVVARVPGTPTARPDLGVIDVSFSTGGAGALDLNSVPGGLWTSGDPLALVWFPTLPANATTIPIGTRYGLFTRNTPDLAMGSAAWITPTDASVINLTFFTTDGGTFSPGVGANPASSGQATLTVAPIPEPATVGLIALGALGLATRRRRQG